MRELTIPNPLWVEDLFDDRSASLVNESSNSIFSVNFHRDRESGKNCVWLNNLHHSKTPWFVFGPDRENEIWDRLSGIVY